METVTLKASLRTDQGKGAARRLRTAGRIPSVAYGKTNKGEETDTLALAIEADALRDILLGEGGRNTIIALEVDGDKKVEVMLKEYEVHPVTRKLLHADFQRVDPSRPVVVEVPFVTVGKSKGEGEGGTLLVNVRSLKVRCLPTNIPNAIEHDVTSLGVNDEVKVKELTLPEHVEVLLAPERKLVIIAPPRVVAADTTTAEADKKEGEAKKDEGKKDEG